MGGSPSERKISSSTNNNKSSNMDNNKAQRYIQNKKGRTSFFLYHRTAPNTTSTTTATAAEVPKPPQIAVTNKKNAPNNNNNSNDALPESEPAPMLFEMEVVSLSSDSEESDDNFTTTPDTSGIFSSSTGTTNRRSIRRRSRTTAAVLAAANETSSPTGSVVEPHIATRVQFSNIEIRSYTITIGDHPCCTIGCPITLDWDYTVQDVVSVLDYETLKYGNEHTLKTMNDLRISPEERVELLLHSAKQPLSELEIRRASRKFHRYKNCSVRQCERVHETFFHCRHKGTDDDSEEEEEEEEEEDHHKMVMETD
jgi:hypothetical protein